MEAEFWLGVVAQILSSSQSGHNESLVFRLSSFYVRTAEVHAQGMVTPDIR